MPQFPDAYLHAVPSSDRRSTTWVLQLASKKALDFTKEHTPHTVDENNWVSFTLPEGQPESLEALEAVLGPFDAALTVCAMG